MEANYLKKLDYVCEHNHTFGHVMDLKWGDKENTLRLSVDFQQGMAGILVNNNHYGHEETTHQALAHLAE